MKNVLEKILKSRSLIVHVIWIGILIYAIASINVLVLAFKTYRQVPGAFLNPHALLFFSVISFVMVVLVAVYHLSTLIRRRKRRSDKMKISRRKYLQAKHRRGGRINGRL
jgi:uncharacterized membrane protein YbhN (UPF0104 family)